MIIHDFCGAFTMVNYTGKIFAESGSNLPPNESAVIVGVIQLIGTYISTLFVDRVGRKVMQIENRTTILNHRSFQLINF